VGSEARVLAAARRRVVKRDAVLIPVTDELLNGVAKARPLMACALCGGNRLERILNLGSSPPPCVMHPVGRRPVVEESYPLELMRCRTCDLVQLSVAVDPAVMFPAEYPYSSGNSPQLHRNFEDLAAEVWETVGGLEPDDLVVDIGANDGTLLSKFGHCRTLGVEPTAQARKIETDSFETFFSEETADVIVEAYGQARVITACNVLAHVEDLGSVMRGITKLLAPNGVLVAENHDLQSVASGQWDMVYHEHLRFYSPRTFSALLHEHGLGCAGWRRTGTHGGSFRMFATRCSTPLERREADELDGLQAKASERRRALRATIAKNGPVVGIGAAARATTILNYCGLDAEDVECVVEVSGSDKIGYYIPGTRIPVVDEEYLFTSDRPAVMLSWHLTDIVIPKLRKRGYDNPIIVPLPELYFEVSANDAFAEG
jgi:hypothetical protein